MIGLGDRDGKGRGTETESENCCTLLVVIGWEETSLHN